MKTAGMVLFAASSLALAACGGVKDDAQRPGDDTTEAADLTPEGPSITASLFGGGEPVAIDVQQAHPNGVVLQLASLQAKSSETIVKAIITNGDDSEQSLNRFGNNKQTYIVAEDGTKLYISPPTSNTKLQIPAGQRMEAELVFLGRLPKGSTASLIINDGDNTDNEYTTTPGFRIPLPLSEAAFSDDGSKKN